MSEPNVESVVCAGCGVTNPRAALRCANCGRLLPAGSIDPTQQFVVVPHDENDPPLRPVPGGQFTLGSLMLIITLCSVCFALLVAAPGLGIGMAIASLPAFIRTSMLVRRREELGRPIAPLAKAAAFGSSLATVIVCTVVVLVASIGVFCGVCLVSYDAIRDASIPFALLSAVVATIAAIVLLAKWLRRRWRRDLEKL